MSETAEQEREAWGVWGKRTLDSIIEVIVERDEALDRIAVLTELLRDLEKAADKVAYDIAYYGSRVDDAVLRTNVRRIAGNARTLAAKITTTLAAVPMTGETK